MKRKKLLLFIALAILLFSLAACGGSNGGSGQTVSVSWSYDTSASNVAGFKLYANYTETCATSDPTARHLDCSVSLPACLTITAYDFNGWESMHSTPYCI